MMRVKFAGYGQSSLDLASGEKRLYKRRATWYYSPDKTEKWLRAMASDGWILYKVKNDDNEFCFVKREPSDIEYTVDSKSSASDESFRSNLDNGWVLLHNGNTDLTIWGYENGKKPSAPFAGDKNALLRYVRRGMLFNLMCLAAALLVFIPFKSFGIFEKMAAFKIVYIAALVILAVAMAGNLVNLTASFFRLVRRGRS